MKDTIPQIHLCLRNVWVGYLWLYCFISRSKLFSLCSLEPVQHFMKQVDLMFYQNLIQVLVPDVLKPIPATLTQSIRNFAKSKHSFNHNSKKKKFISPLQKRFFTMMIFQNITYHSKFNFRFELYKMEKVLWNLYLFKNNDFFSAMFL